MMLSTAGLPIAHDLTSALTTGGNSDPTLDTSSSPMRPISRQPSMGVTMLGTSTDSSPSPSPSLSPLDSPSSSASMRRAATDSLSDSAEFLTPQESPLAEQGTLKKRVLVEEKDEETEKEEVTEELPFKSSLWLRVARLEKVAAEQLLTPNDRASDPISGSTLEARIANLEKTFTDLLSPQKSQPNLPFSFSLQASGSLQQLRSAQKKSEVKQSPYTYIPVSILVNEDDVYFFEQNVNYFDSIIRRKEEIFYSAWQEQGGHIVGMMKHNPDHIAMSAYISKVELQPAVTSSHTDRKASTPNHFSPQLVLPTPIESKKFRICGIATCSEYYPQESDVKNSPIPKNMFDPIIFKDEENKKAYRVESWVPGIGQVKVLSVKNGKHSFEPREIKVCSIPLHFLPKAVESSEKKLDLLPQLKSLKQTEREKKRDDLKRKHIFGKIQKRKLELERKINEIDEQLSSTHKNKTCFNFASFFPSYLNREKNIKSCKIDFLNDLITVYEKSPDEDIYEVVNKVAAFYMYNKKWDTVKAGIIQAKTFDLLKSLGFDQVIADKYVEELKQIKSAPALRLSASSGS